MSDPARRELRVALDPVVERRDRIVTAVALLMLIGALIGIGSRLGGFTGQDAERPSAPSSFVENWHGFAESGALLGNRTGPVRLVVFSDYTCAACRRLRNTLDTILASFPDKIQIVWRHFPNEANAFSVGAAVAAVCATEQGRFESFNRVAFVNIRVIGADDWDTVAKLAEVPDRREFVRCIGSTRGNEVVARDQAAGNQLGITATPTILIDSARYDGRPPDLVRIVTAFVQR